ncbi:MAG: family efflux transporter [Polyangiaceae bacterium]|jgi:putative MATE family efflux protein|nr:family efflux transporter [Polyangiaceae bacterium]
MADTDSALVIEPTGPQDPSVGTLGTLVGGSVARKLLTFSMPILATSILQSLNTSINAAWIGHLLGPGALTASVNANSLIFLVFGIAAGPGEAVNFFVGQSVGAGDLERAKRITGTAIAAFAAFSLAVTLTGLACVPEVLRAMRTPSDALPLASSYLKVALLAVPATYLYTCLSLSMRGGGNSRSPLWFQFVAVIVDTGLNPLLISGVGPLPALGMAGSALAMVIAQTLTLGAFFVYLRRRRPAAHLTLTPRYLRPDLGLLRKLVVKGFPISLQMVVISTSLLAVVSLVNRYGTLTVAAYGACFQVWSYVQMPAFAVSAAVSSMAAQNIGARRWERVDRIAYAGVLYSVVLTGVLVSLLKVWGRHGFVVFLGKNEEAIAIAEHINDIVSWSFIVFAVSFTLTSVTRATGAVLAPFLITVVGLWLVRVPVAVSLEPVLHADAIFWSTPAASLAILAMTLVYYRRGRWRVTTL